MWLAVNLLPNSPKISYLSNRGVFQLNVSWINGNSIPVNTLTREGYSKTGAFGHSSKQISRSQ